MTSRIKEIDVLRGIAIIMMIAFHFLFDLNYFTNAGINLSSGAGWLLGRSTAVMFLGLVGISLTLSYNKIKHKTKKEIYAKYARRGLEIFVLGLAITAITYISFPEQFIRFGILHLIGLSVILSVPFLESKYSNLVLGSAIIGFGYFVNNLPAKSSWLLWLGVKPEYFASLDYFPVFPWFGLVLIGLSLGNHLFPDGKPIFKLPDIQIPKISDFLAYLGRKSLLIYLIHQPILIGLILLLC